jgi:hypothetical protein
MKKNLKFNWFPFVFIAIVVLIVLLSCNAQKKAIKKDAQAVDRVLGSRALIDKIKPAVLELYPCANDTVEVWLSGGVDSIPYPVTKIDTVFQEKEGGYMQGFIDGQEVILKRKIPVKRPDTIRVTVVDRQRQKADAETIKQLQLSISKLDGQIVEKDRALAKPNPWIWYFIIAVVLLLLSNIVWVYLKVLK